MSGSIKFIDTRTGCLRVALSGPTDAPVLVFSNSLGTTLEMWDVQAETFSRDYRVVRYDTRGHGGSVVTPGPYSFDQLGEDVIALLDALDVPRASFCGISMGGHTGLWLGINAPARFDAIAVCNSAAKIGTRDGWTSRAAQVREGGGAAMSDLAASSPSRWFTDAFARCAPELVARAQSWIAGLSPEGYAACCEALAVSDLWTQIDRISVPTLLLAGAADPVTTVAEAESMQRAIAFSRIATVPASHLSNLEAPEQFNAAIISFLSGCGAIPQE
ncbi:3-oxoadipate enol-lactonase [Cupriavidus basilensis]|uniref:3-oxoadipate enol-lactonase n=1 Tax=Cupriavidus basilensis TaxID=68895 RepID=A0ABT6AZI3_9BURK|nr:3-oxoadipate enol-lactonase [Cupriavidus basilensis]MDF3838028.1 3-oxoadipate enol-lactonase [Cupriavidus basilensis]